MRCSTPSAARRATPDEVLAAWRENARRLPDAIATATRMTLEEDTWRPDDHQRTLARIEALKQGIAKRARRVLKNLSPGHGHERAHANPNPGVRIS